MEAYGAPVAAVNVTCMLLEGSIKEITPLVKEEGGAEAGSLLSTEQYQTLVTKVYEEKNATKLPDLPYLFEKYKGREHELFRQVCEKYDANPDELAADLPMPAAPAAKVEDDEFAHLESEDMPELSATEYALLIQSIYERYNPKKLQDMGRLLARYRGRERELYFEVCKKYGTHPTKFHARQLKERQAEAVGGGN